LITLRVDLREPGNHHTVWEGRVSFVPREGEWIVLPGNDEAQTVHSVSYDLASDTAILLVNPL
jgi:hypothetical protein